MPQPSFFLLHERPNSKAKTFQQWCRRISPTPPQICAFALGIYLPLSVRPVKICGFSYLLSVSSICSSFFFFFSFFLLCGPERKLPTLERVRACLSHDPRVAHCSSLQSKTSTSIMTAHYLPCSHIKLYIYTTEDITSLLIYTTIMAVLEPCRKLKIRLVAKMAWMTDGLGN